MWSPVSAHHLIELRDGDADGRGVCPAGMHRGEVDVVVALGVPQGHHHLQHQQTHTNTHIHIHLLTLVCKHCIHVTFFFIYVHNWLSP